MPHIKNALIRYRVIDKLLRSRSRPFPSKQDLRHACEEELYGAITGEHISDSTIEKDLYAMRMEMDAPIKYKKSEEGYYYSDPNFSIHEIPLSEDDVQSIKFAASTLAQFKNTSMFKQFGFALDKILDRAATSKAANSDPEDETVQFEKGVGDSGNQFLGDLLKAIKSGVIVYFDYTSFISGIRKRRKVTPLLLKEYRNRWYLISFDNVKQDIITYSLDRMEDLEITSSKGDQPKKFDPDLFFKHSIGITTSDHQPETVLFRANKIASKYIASQPFHSSQKVIKETQDESVFELYVLVSEELIRGLLSYGGEVEIIEPNHLRNELKKRVSAMHALYH